MKTTTGSTGGRPMVMGTRGVVSSGHYLATEIGLGVLRGGGNAMDAAAAVGFALALLKPHQCGIAGEAPILVRSAAEDAVWAISGHGTAPAAATIEHFRGLGVAAIPSDGFLPAIVPPAVAGWIRLLERFGTIRLADALAPAVELAESGFVMYDALRDSIAGCAERMRREWPSSAEVFLPGGQPPASGQVWPNPGWAATLRKLLDADARCRDRLDGLRAAHDAFYRGPIAEAIVAFSRDNPVPDAAGGPHAGLLTTADFAAYEPRVEEPVRADYRGVTVFKCGPWTQGPVLLQSLNLLANFDLRGMGHNSADTIHTVVECMKLAYADREFYYGDPAFVPVPLERLLSAEYAAERAGLVRPDASMDLRPGGLPAIRAEAIGDVDAAVAAAGPADGDTTKLEVIDAAGNMVSATPSGGWLTASPVIPGMGFPLGTRGQMFSLVPEHPNALQPGKRPRTTLTPSLAIGGGSMLAFGSPGGDCQDQWALQFFLNVVAFGMGLQEAVEAPTFWTNHFPGSFYPRSAEPGSLHVETRLDPAVREELAKRGHRLREPGDWAGGNTLAASADLAAGVLAAAASPRLEPAYAAAW